MKDTAKTRRRRGPRHPGVVFLKPNAKSRTWWRARFVDPDSGKLKTITLDPSLTTAEARSDWATKKSRALAVRRLELEQGAPRATGTKLDKAIDRYFDDHPHHRDGTIEIYKLTSEKLKAWAKRVGLESADELNAGKLVAFRASLIKEELSVPVGGKGRGARETRPKRRAPATVNRELRAIGTVLTYVRRLGLLPRLSSDELTDSLKKLPVPLDRVSYLKSAELKVLLEAALRHDAAKFTETREEHAGRGSPGSTPRYEPIAPFIAYVLLTGKRFAEALDVVWDQVDLDAIGDDGKVAGEVYLFADRTKTKRGRTVDLAVSPFLRDLLLELKRRKSGSRVFPLTRDAAKKAIKRAIEEYGAPAFSTKILRRTCGSYLTNAPGIFGAASAYRSARQLGHSVAVAEKHYLGVIRGIPPEASTLEAAMQIETELNLILTAIRGAG